MKPRSTPNYLAGYPAALVAQIRDLIEQGKLLALLRQKYPLTHDVRTDKALYDYVQTIKSECLGNVGQLSKVAYDSKLHVMKNALGTHTTVSRVQGGNLRSKREIRIAAMFREMPPEFLRMIVVHELVLTSKFTFDLIGK